MKFFIQEGISERIGGKTVIAHCLRIVADGDKIIEEGPGEEFLKKE